MSKTTKHLLLAIGSGSLLAASWPINGITLLIFIGLIPLLILEDSIRKDEHNKKGIRGVFIQLPHLYSLEWFNHLVANQLNSIWNVVC